MKKSTFIISLLAALSLSACSGRKPDADEAFAAQRGREDAAKAVKARPGSMDREKALLHIRATEHKILQLADSAAAHAYKHAAEAYLDSAGVAE